MVEPRNFNDDLNNADTPKIRNAWLKIFKKKFGDEIEVDYKDELCIQKGLGTDVTIKTKSGRRYSVELKTRNNNCLNKDYIMEIVSHTYDKPEKPWNHLYSKDGWIYTTTAEYIFHGTLNENRDDFLEVILYSLIPFKTPGWKSEFDKYEHFFLPTKSGSGVQLTLNKLIPKEVIKQYALEFWEWNKE